jgi:hypothetical protein
VASIPIKRSLSYFANIANQDSVKQDFRLYEEKNVCITGTIELMNGKPEMIVEKESQIVVE